MSNKICLKLQLTQLPDRHRNPRPYNNPPALSTRVDKREQVSTILVNISVNEAVVFTSIFQLLVVLALLGRILDADWSENGVRIGWSSVYCTMERH